jgi:hypothetical protein
VAVVAAAAAVLLAALLSVGRVFGIWCSVLFYDLALLRLL